MSPLARLFSALILLYRWTLSHFLGHGCRFLPTCSQYALDAVARHGAWRGGWLTLRRLARCHPWGGGGLDFVPDVDFGPDLDAAPVSAAPPPEAVRRRPIRRRPTRSPASRPRAETNGTP